MRTVLLPVVGFTVGVVLLLGRFAPDSPAGRLIGKAVIASTRRIQRDEARTPTFREYALIPPGTRKHRLIGLAVARDGRLAVGDNEGTIRIVDPASGTALHELTDGGGVKGWSPDGRTLALAYGPFAALWSPGLDAQPRRMGRHRKAVTSILFAPDGTLLSSSEDRTIRRWDVATGEELGRRVHGSTEQDSSDWRQLLWVRDLAQSPDGRLLASAGNDGFVRFWEAATGREVGSIHGVEYMWTNHGSSTLWSDIDISPDGRAIAALLSDGRLAVWKLPSGQALGGWEIGIDPTQRPEPYACTVQFSRDGGALLVVAISGWDREMEMEHKGAIDVFDLATGLARLHWEGSRLTDAALTSDGRVVAITDSALLVEQR